MKLFVKGCKTLSMWMNWIAGVSVFFMMGLTVADVALRFFGKPIGGSYELMSMAGALVIGMAMAQTSLERAHVHVDMLTDRLSQAVRKCFFVLTRVFSLALFMALAWFLVGKAADLHKAGNVSNILHIPQDLLVYVLAFCACIQCVALLVDLVMLPDKEVQ